MMSLVKIGFSDLVKKQYLFKLRAYSGIFSTLIVLQALGIFFSIIGGSSSGTWSTNIEITVSYKSAEQVIVFTLIWIFISAILITTKAYREDDFTFVTNRKSNNLANGLILLTASLIGGITAYLSGFLIKVIMRFFNYNYIAVSGLPPTWLELISGIVALVLILLLVSVVGYLAGNVIQMNRIFTVILPVLVIGFLALVNNVGNGRLGVEIFSFYFAESSILLFMVKTIVTTVLLFIFSLLVSNRQEVRI